MFTNDDRRATVDKAITEFATDMGLDPAIDADGPIIVAGDMICNILHWVQQQTDGDQNDGLQAARSGLSHYVTESLIDYSEDNVDEVGPQSFVKITADCDGKEFST